MPRDAVPSLAAVAEVVEAACSLVRELLLDPIRSDTKQDTSCAYHGAGSRMTSIPDRTNFG